MRKKYKEGWVEVLPSHAFKTPLIDEEEEREEDFFNISLLREVIGPSQYVMYFPESVKIMKDQGGDKTAWVQIINENMEILIIPVYALGFSEEQKMELILRKRIPKKYFNHYHLVSSFN